MKTIKSTGLNRLAFAIPLILAMMLVNVFIAGAPGAAYARALSYIPSAQVQETFEGCRFTPGLTLPDGSGQYICPDADYTSGNLAKGWNELDLVPFRLTTQLGTQTDATTDYNLIIAGDYFNGGTAYGWDVISVPVLNAAKSDASCTVSAGPQTLGSGITGGAQSSQYRILTIHQAKGTTCVFDYYQRLALGAAQYNGSSLQSYMFEGSDFKSGKKAIPIPVKEALPQTISKNMTATQGSNHVWNLTKAPLPTKLDFGDTCKADAIKSLPVQITITWTKGPALPDGLITVITNIYATNPAARMVTINVTDVIRSGTTPLDTATSGPVNIPANKTQLVFTHTFGAQSGTIDLNDVATATYIDTVTGIVIPQTTTATASANVQFTGPELNGTAVISDIESITGTTLVEFSADSFTPSSIGSFNDGYVAGQKTLGPVSWISVSQSGDASVTFDKTVSFIQPSSTTGGLDDTAVLTGSNGASASANASVMITTDARVSLTINKTIDYSDNATFTFHVKDVKDIEVAAPTITFAKGGPTTKSVSVGNLTPGSYLVSEDPLENWAETSAKPVTIDLPSCAGSVSFENKHLPYLKLVKTVTNDNGGTAVPTDFVLSATLQPYVLSGAGGAESFVAPGAYALSETQVSGYSAGPWVCTGGGTQSDNNILLGLSDVTTCTINNDDKQSYVTVVKVVNNTHGGTAAPNDFLLKLDAGAVSSGVPVPVLPGTFTASETLLPGYTFNGFSGDCDKDGKITVALGESKTCTLTNSDKQSYVTVVKVVNNTHGGTAAPNDFLLKLDAGAVSSGVPVPVLPGTFTASETLLPGYTFNGFSSDCDKDGKITVALGESKTCTLTNSDIAPILHLRKVVKNDNGGTKTVADFTLTANGAKVNNSISGTSPVDSGPGLKADTWALSETTQYGYIASAWVCVGGTQSSSNITLKVGEEATCTITNDDQPGKIIVIKNAKPAQGSFAFTTTGTGYNGFALTGATTNNGNINTQILNAGTYTVHEDTQLGWILTGIGGSTDPNTPYNCVVTGAGGSTGVGDLSTQTATIELKIGDTVTCTFENTGMGVTRTQGFWATHPELAQIAWFGGTAFNHTFPGVANTTGIGDMLICGRPVDSLEKLMGGFWSDISKTSTGAKRSALDQARMQLLQQLLAAELNASAFGSVPAKGTFDAWETALCGTNAKAIQTAQQQAASFNTNGDSGTFTPGTSANSKHAREIADYKFWNIIKP